MAGCVADWSIKCLSATLVIQQYYFPGLLQYHAKVAELVDALALGASGVTRGSSTLPFRTNSVLTN